ncbi:hypothetical protein JHN55_36605 [Streptomyces sp. MBT56]|uniref:hypothetical protein n=1 Tax=unclassified Streptomyces TaxID=2593676 RepID=UPI00190994E6|nr:MULTISPECIES: hypothetical protein [unclassified Streptomyces]MBK3561962.1 hypothetical protein [Streptomyces sp. MBT56]MBK3604486.1 hypothetical protein [Streptomyces sp. MBT54]MBK3617514.1 hypothetical protein [Streptomyces sp. MBT98]MBK6044418.1 hypothetical protein [Streptomyces sp. MBT55]
MLIEGYGHGPLVAGESLVGRRGFWANHLLAMCGDGTCAEWAVPEWFGGDGADADALAEVLFDSEQWPVFRVLVPDGRQVSGVVVVYRNFADEFGVDYLLGGQDRCLVAGLSWQELIRVADCPEPPAEGVQDVFGRFLLLLPLLSGEWSGDVVRERIFAALVAVGAPEGTVGRAAGHLLGHLERRALHDAGWGSPLSGG